MATAGRLPSSHSGTTFAERKSLRLGGRKCLKRPGPGGFIEFDSQNDFVLGGAAADGGPSLPGRPENIIG